MRLTIAARHAKTEQEGVMETQAEITPGSSIWSKAAAILIAVLVTSLFVLWLASLFAPRPRANPIPKVVDSAGVFSKQTVDALTALHFPDDTPVIVRTVSKIPSSEIGSFATEAMNHDPNWQSLRPRGFLRRYFRHDLPYGTGVYVLVSVEPLLLQIRFGDEIRLAAYQSGLADGPWYRQQQIFPRAQIETHAVAVVNELAGKMKDVRHPSWLMSLVERLPSEAYSEIEDLLAPSSEAGSTIVTWYVKILNWLGGTKSLFTFFMVNVFVLFLPWTILTKVLLRGLVDADINKAVSIVLTIIANCGVLGIALMSVVALGLMGHGRIEDELALSNLGLGFFGSIGFSAQSYARAGGILIALPAAILRFFVELLEASQEQREAHNKTTVLPLGCLVWAAVLFVLPLAIGFYSIPLLLWQLAKAIVESVKENAQVTSST
jgi:hypothetical protein